MEKININENLLRTHTVCFFFFIIARYYLDNNAETCPCVVDNNNDYYGTAEYPSGFVSSISLSTYILCFISVWLFRFFFFFSFVHSLLCMQVQHIWMFGCEFSIYDRIMCRQFGEVKIKLQRILWNRSISGTLFDICTQLIFSNRLKRQQVIWFRNHKLKWRHCDSKIWKLFFFRSTIAWRIDWDRITSLSIWSTLFVPPSNVIAFAKIQRNRSIVMSDDKEFLVRTET